MAKISIIIPAYNAEKTVERTVRSVLASTIPLDVWVVDDGSTDGTGAVLDRLVGEMSGSGTAELESSVPLSNSNSSLPLKVIHQKNCGAYQARLNALKQIRTPYFGFVDADDTVEPDMFEKMLGCIERNGLDCVQCGIVGVGAKVGVGDMSGTKVVSSTVPLELDPPTSVPAPTPKILEGDSLARYKSDYLVNSRESCFIWDKLYRNQFDFSAFDPTDRVTNFDDMIFNLQFFLKIKRMGFLNEPLYHYATTEGSAVHSFSESKLKDFCEVVRVRRALLPQYGADPDGAENRAWFKLNRMNCIKATVRAGNLSVLKKLSIIRKLFVI